MAHHRALLARWQASTACRRMHHGLWASRPPTALHVRFPGRALCRAGLHDQAPRLLQQRTVRRCASSASTTDALARCAPWPVAMVNMRHASLLSLSTRRSHWHCRSIVDQPARPFAPRHFCAALAGSRACRPGGSVPCLRLPAQPAHAVEKRCGLCTYVLKKAGGAALPSSTRPARHPAGGFRGPAYPLSQLQGVITGTPTL